MGLNFIPREATSTLTLAAAKNLFNTGAFQTPLRGVTLFKFQSTNPRASSNDAAMENVPGMFGLGGNQTKEQKKQILMQSIQQQQNIENARVLIDKINSNCFEKCVPKPGSSLSSGETTCLTNCMQKYMNAWNAVSAAYIFRIKSDPSST